MGLVPRPCREVPLSLLCDKEQAEEEKGREKGEGRMSRERGWEG